MKNLILTLALASSFASQSVFATSDVLDHEELVFSGPEPEAKLMTAMSDLKSVLKRFHPVLQKGSTLLSGPSVSGTARHPILKMSIEKCVLMICKKVNLDAEVSMRENSGPCDRNIVINADLARSGSPLADIYLDLVLNICYKNESIEQGRLKVTASAVRAPTFGTGMVQGAVTKSLTLQIQALVDALERSLR